MKTLYISDLDGTLLNDSALLSDKSADILNSLIIKGVYFSLATARTYSTAVPITKSLNLNIPAVLMNGVCIYDLIKLEPVKYHPIPYATAVSILQIFEKHGKEPMLYYDKTGNLTVEYKTITTKAQEAYVSHRKNYYKKSMLSVKEYSLNEKSDLVYFAILDSQDSLSPIYDEISKRDDVTSNFYTDTYSKDYFLEIYSKNASKAKSALEVKKLIGADKIVAFGDNLNDIPLFQIADEAYAVSNACDELKQYATGVIGNNNEDAVAEFILKRYENGEI